MEKLCKICRKSFNTNYNRVFSCSKECNKIYLKSDEYKKFKYEYDKNRRKTSERWKLKHKEYYTKNAKAIYKKRKENYLPNLTEELKERYRQSQINYSKSLQGKLHTKNNFAKNWIKKKYPGRYIENTTYEQILDLYNNTNGFCPICGKELIQFDMDHKISLNNGGEHRLDNIHFICHMCNLKKGSKNLDQFLKDNSVTSN